MSWKNIVKRHVPGHKEPMDRVSTTASTGQDEEAAKRTEDKEADLLAQIRARNKKSREMSKIYLDAPVRKAPPIRNPRESEFKDNANDDLSLPEHIDLFKDKVDPVIREAGKKKETYADIKLTDLKMTEKKAQEIARKLYADMGYNAIFVDNGILTFKLQGEGKL